MADAMVTARMSQEKKDEGNRVLAQLGTNASQAVNRLYDYVLERRELPFPEMKERRKYTDEEIARAMEWVDGIPGWPKATDIWPRPMTRRDSGTWASRRRSGRAL